MQRQTTRPLTSAKSLHFLPKLCFVLSSACRALAGYHALGYKAEGEAVFTHGAAFRNRHNVNSVLRNVGLNTDLGARGLGLVPLLLK